MNKSESKYYNTARLMDEALEKLLEQKDFEYITVKEICAKAGVNRSTFYLHYESVTDLLAETLEYATKHFYASFAVFAGDFREQIEDAPLDRLVFINEQYLRPYLTFIRDHRALYAAAYRSPDVFRTQKISESVIRNIFKPVMSRFGIAPENQPYHIIFFIRGCHGIIEEWLRRRCETPVEEIERILIACIRPEIGSLGGDGGTV